MSKSIEKTKPVKVPAHLKQYVVEQHYDRYTAINHAVWRYVMRQNMNFLEGKAHPTYVNGLLASGMNIESLPKVEEMNESLSRFGWGAVTIDGFIPGVAFFDFQAHGILPIATDIRTLKHIAYTPAPDIIHEAAGHAPIIADPKYADYLKIFGEIGAKAIATKEEHEVFEAIKHLSALMENGVSTNEEIAEAEQRLKEKQAAASEFSEATLISRLYWWTVEYGLIGDINKPEIYGAGLLSSIGESRSCLSDQVTKLPFDLESCISTDYDVTRPQPQLFVCQNFDELIEAVQEFAKRMAYQVGGTEALVKALNSGRTSTVVYSSGLEASGTVSKLEYDPNAEAIYFNMSGPSALAYDRQELSGHGKDYHHDGFGSPIGPLKGVTTPIEQMTDEQLKNLGLKNGNYVTLEFESGVRVTGWIKKILRQKGQVVLISFEQCAVTLGDSILYRPDWGTYDMAVGVSVVSVYAGAADRERFYAEEVETRDSQLSDKALNEHSNIIENEIVLNELYQLIRDTRETQKNDSEIIMANLKHVSEQLDSLYPNDWLLRLEIIEILAERKLNDGLSSYLLDQLEQLKKHNEEWVPLIENGLKLAKIN